MIEAQQEIHRSELSVSNGIHTELSAVVGYRVVTASDGLSALNLVTEHNPDLLLLSDPLSVMDTYRVVTRIREFSSVPIMVLSSHPDGNRAVYMLEAGVDDYLVRGKFGDEELVAKARALLRRAYVYPGQYLSGKRRLPILTNGELTIDQDQRLVMLSDEEVPLTQREYRLLAYLARNLGKVCLHESILSKIWGDGYEGEYHLLRVNVDRLRSDLGKDGAHYVVTAPGVGYFMPNLNHSEDETNDTKELPLLNEIDSTDKLRLVVGPMDPKGEEDKLWFYEITREQFAGENIPTAIINILRFLPDGMGVLAESLQRVLGISRGALFSRLFLTRVFLKEQRSDYTIGNASTPPKKARYYWKKVR